MANLENNYDKEKKHDESRPDQVSLENAKELVKDAVENPMATAKEFGEQAAKDVTSYTWWAKLLLIVFWTGLSLVILAVIAVNLPVTKRWAANQALQILNEDFKAEMTTESISVDYFGDVLVKGLKIKDYKGMDFIKAREFRANSDWISLATSGLKGNNLSFKALSLTNADIKVVTYKGDSISNFVRYTQLFDSDKEKDPNKPPFQLNSRVTIIDSKVSIINQNSEGDAGKWLQATNFNLYAPKVAVNGGDVVAQINNMNFRTKRWGKEHYVDTFTTDLSMTKQYLSLKDLTLNTDHTLLQGDIGFRLNNGSWADFTDRVRWDMEIDQGSQLSGYDISYFVTNWDNYKPFNVSGKMTGPLNGFYLENFLVRNPDVNIRTSTMKVARLLKGNFQIETNTLSTDFTYKDLKAMMPTFISSKMKNFADDFGRLKYSGAVRVTPTQVFVPNGSLITGIGQAKISNFYLEDFSTNLPRYRGYAEVRDLNTSVITKSDQVGLVTGKFNIQGESFDVNTMRLRTRSEIASIEILNKEINNVFLDGNLDHRKYTGIINVNDEHAKANVNGLIDFSTSRIFADVVADVRHLNINYFTGGKGTQIVSGNIDGKISMTDINDLSLDADLRNIVFTSATQKFTIPNADVKAYTENGNRIVTVDAPGAVNGRIAGKYNLGDLTGMIQNGLGKILVGPPPRKIYRGQHFNMEFDVKQDLVNYFEPNIRIPRGATISGSYDGNSNNLVLNADVAAIKYLMTTKEEITDADRALAAANPAYNIPPGGRTRRDSAMVDNLILRINTANLDEQIFAKVDRAEYNKNIFKDLTLTGRNENNQLLHLSANFKHGTPEDEFSDNLKDYAININQSTNSAGDYVFRFEPTEVKLNNVAWHIDTDPKLNHSITYRKKTGDFLIENLRVYSDESELLVNRAIFKNAKDFEADATVKNLEIGKLLEMQTSGNSMDIKGVANGNIKIRMNQNNLEPVVDLTIDNILMNGQDMGNIVISAKNSSVPNVFDVEARVVSAGIIGDNNLLVTGTINNNTSNPTLDIKADMNDFDLAFAQEFVKGVFSNMRGKANGILSISGTLKDIDYSGDIDLSDFGLKLNFTGVDYSLEDTVIPLSRGLATLNEVRVKDGRANSGGTISGVIQFETLASMAVNLIMRADNLMVLNTQQKDFDLFWGRIYGEGYLYVSGPVSGLTIATDLNEPFRALNNSIFTFNAGSTSSVDEFKMLRFLKEDQAGVISLEEKKRSGANMTLDFNLAVDRGTTVNVMLPEDVGDISVRGTANPLRFRMTPNGNISMNGSYLVDSGTFVSTAILERTFQIAKGSSIRWDGDAMAPQLDINANYLRTVTNAGQYLTGQALQPINVLLSVKIDGTLNDPNINLGVSAQDVSSQLRETLASKMSNEDEKIIQFGSVLVMNSFNIADAGGFDVNVGNTLESSGYNMLFRQLGAVLNTISNEFQVDMNYLKGDQGSNTGDRANASVSFALSPRIKVKTGLGIPISRTENTANNYLSGEGIIEYDWSKNNDGTRLVRGYSKPSNIGLVAGNAASANQTYGVGVVYSKSFNTIFKRKKKKSNSNNATAVVDSIKIDTISSN